jgi:hypothetical protein
METLLTFTVCASYKVLSTKASGRKMLNVKLVKYQDNTVYLVEELEGNQDVLVMKNPDYNKNISSDNPKDINQYLIRTLEKVYYLNIDF